MQFFSLISKKLSSSKGRLNGYDNAYTWCNLLELSGASKIAKQIISKISTYVFLFLPDDFDYPLLELRGYMEMLQKFIKDELGNRLFLYIPDEDHVKWYEKKDGFGIDVSIAFPSAIEDVKEAGNCYANGRYTQQCPVRFLHERNSSGAKGRGGNYPESESHFGC